MQCPICGGMAKDITRPGFDGISIRCPVDGDFDVASGYGLKLMELSPVKRQYVLNSAIVAAPPNTRPCITKASVSMG